MAGRNGVKSPSHSTRHGPTPLTHMPASTAALGFCAIKLVLIAHTSRHHSASASTSAQPGRGRFIEWAMVSEAITEPDVSTRTPFVLPVPMSIPSSKSTRQTLVAVPDRTTVRPFGQYVDKSFMNHEQSFGGQDRKSVV